MENAENGKPALRERVKNAKAKIVSKTKTLRAKIGKAAKHEAAALCAFGIVEGLALLLMGCASADPASRLTRADYGDLTVIVDGGSTAEIHLTLGDGALASADSAGSTETTTATPTNTTDVDAALDVPVNKANSGTSAAGGAAERLLGAGADWLSGKITNGAPATAAQAAQPCADCQPSTCEDCEAK